MIGAYSAERTVSATAPSTTRSGLTVRSSSQSMNARSTPRIFGASNVAIAMMNSRIIRSLSNNGQRGNSDISSVKYSNCTVAMWPAVPKPDDDQREPQRRSEIAHHADAHVRAVRPREALAPDDGEMLDVALRPTPVARRDVEQRRRAVFPAAAERRQHAHGPARAAQQRGFDEVVRQDRAAERLLARQNRQARGRGERAHADDRVVAPVVAVVALPARHAARDDRAVDAARELLQSREQRAAAGEPRHGLQQAEFGSAAISRTSVTSVSGARMLSASSTIMKS